MATLNLWNYFEMSSQGIVKAGKQGLAADAPGDGLAVTVTGTAHHVTGSLATATAVTVWDDDDDAPADWDYLFFWADQDLYIQLIGSGSNVVFKIEATQPFVLPGFDTLLAAASTTAITGGTEPTLTDIDSVVLGNYSGSTANYLFCVID